MLADGRDVHTNVAAQVQEDTTAEATKPLLTVLPAVLKTSLVCNSLLYRFRTNVVNIIPNLWLTVSYSTSFESTNIREEKPQAYNDAIASGLAKRRCCCHAAL